MKITLILFGYEIGAVNVELDEFDPDTDSIVEKATKATSRWWMKRMVK